MLAPGLPALIAGRFQIVHRFLVKKWYFDELYDLVFVRPAFYLGREFWKTGDGLLIDGVGPDGVSAAVLNLARRAGGGAATAETIKIGMVQPLTGFASFGGNTLLNGARMAVEVINAKGGIHGKKLELVPEDGGCLPPKSVNAAEKLIVRDKVSVLLGAYCSSSSGAVKPVTARYHVPQVTGVSTSAKLTRFLPVPTTSL